jgi:hypothetical protein
MLNSPTSLQLNAAGIYTGTRVIGERGRKRFRRTRAKRKITYTDRPCGDMRLSKDMQWFYPARRSNCFTSHSTPIHSPRQGNTPRKAASTGTQPARNRHRRPRTAKYGKTLGCGGESARRTKRTIRKVPWLCTPPHRNSSPTRAEKQTGKASQQQRRRFRG